MISSYSKRSILSFKRSRVESTHLSPAVNSEYHSHDGILLDAVESGNHIEFILDEEAY